MLWALYRPRLLFQYLQVDADSETNEEELVDAIADKEAVVGKLKVAVTEQTDFIEALEGQLKHCQARLETSARDNETLVEEMSKVLRERDFLLERVRELNTQYELHWARIQRLHSERESLADRQVVGERDRLQDSVQAVEKELAEAVAAKTRIQVLQDRLVEALESSQATNVAGKADMEAERQACLVSFSN